MSFPGVPQLSTPSIESVEISILGSAEAFLWDLITTETQWGVFNSGSSAPAVTVDSVIELSARKGAAVSDYKIETGSFASFNKVEKAREIYIRLSKGGEPAERTDFLTWLETEVKSTKIFDVVMPEQTFSGMTLQDYTIRRESRSGVTIIFADCAFLEVREVSAQYYDSDSGKANTANAQSANDVPAASTSRAQSSSYTGTSTSAAASLAQS